MDLERGAILCNAWRVVPRTILIVYYTFFIKAWFYIVNWFMNYDWDTLPADQIVGSVAAAAVAVFPAIILGILTKVLNELTKSYWNGSSSTQGAGH